MRPPAFSATDRGTAAHLTALDRPRAQPLRACRALGNAIVQYTIAHWAELGVEYVIYRQRILQSPTGAWTAMPDRGSPTANHLDHVHVNYR